MRRPASSPQESRFRVEGLDCPAEVQLIRLAFAAELDADTVEIVCDPATRSCAVRHHGDTSAIAARLSALGIGSVSPLPPDAPGAHVALDRDTQHRSSDAPSERRMLLTLLAANATMAVVETAVGWQAESTGVLADALDMLADALVYGMAWWAVGRTVAAQSRAAAAAGATQLCLACVMTGDVIRRSWTGSDPEPPAMLAVSLLALAVNVWCLSVTSRVRDRGLHLRASWIFSTSDVVANLGVIVAAGAVAWFGTRWPDLLIGSIIAAVVGAGAWRILRLTRRSGGRDAHP